MINQLREKSRKMDKIDPLKDIRDMFYLNPNEIYMDGNSLGLMPKGAENVVSRMMNEWKTLGIRGWLEAEKPWFYYSEYLAEKLSKLVGASSQEVTVHSSTTVNIHQLIQSFYKPEGKRTKIMIDALNFPTDRYAIEAFLDQRNLSRDKHLVVIQSEDGQFLDEKKIIEQMTEEVALILLPSVLYRSGQLLDIKKLTKKAHEKGIIIGFDCSHSVGVVDHRFSEHDIDFAMWSNYKYMNNGPGGASGLFINKRHFGLKPALAGWFGSTKDKQFDLGDHLEHASEASAFEIGTPNLLSMAPLEASLSIFEKVGIDEVRKKSKMITNHLIDLIDLLLLDYGFEIGTPRIDQKRGGHVALLHEEAARINEALKENGIIPDFRRPNVIRLAPVPLYISYEEVLDVVLTIKKIMEEESYKKYDNKRSVVA